MKKSLFIVTIITVICLMSVSVYAANFSDVNGHWAKSYIDRWSEEKVVNGYEDGTFKPNNNITRAEFIAMIMRIFEPIQKANLSSYEDVNSSAWYYDTLSKAVAIGAIKGDSNTSIRPNDNITRQEAIVILNRILNLANSSQEANFSDASEIATWAKNAILAFTENEYVNGYEDGSVKPTAYITRAEITKILDKAIGKIIVTSGEFDASDITGSVVIKAENVTLVNDANVKKVFAYNSSVKNSLKTAKEVVVINENANPTNNEVIDNTQTEKKDDEGGSGGGGSTEPSSKTVTITFIPKSDKYEIKKDGELKNGSKVTIVVNGNTIMEDEEFSKDNFFQFKLDLMTALDKAKNNKIIEAKKLLVTMQELKEGSSISVEDVLDSLSDEDKEFLQDLFGDGTNLSDVAKKLSSDDIVSLGKIFLDMDYDTFKSLFNEI